jgi:hypothetical protein
MTGLRRPAAAMTAALLAMLAVVFDSGPGYAATPVKFKWPSGQELVTTADKPVEAYVWFGLTPALDRRATLTLKSLDDPNRPETVVGPEPVGGDPCVLVKFDVPRLAYNGRYQATIASEGALGSLGTADGQCAGASDVSQVSFAVPPVPPGGVKGSLVERSVLLRWDKNPEGDVRMYRVMRAKGNGPFELLKDTDKLAMSINSNEGGDQRFAVVALRDGAKPGDPLLESPLSEAVSLTVPPPPAPPVVPGAVNRGGVRRPATGRSSSRPRTVTTPDTGFRQTLPFAEGPAQIEEGEEEAVPPAQSLEEIGVEEERTDNKRNLAVLAAGLLVTVLVMHLLWVKGEVDREPLEAIGPE